MGAIVVFLLAVAMAGSAIGLFLYADVKGRRDEVNLRLRAGDMPTGKRGEFSTYFR